MILVAVGVCKTESGEAASRANISLPPIQLEMLQLLAETEKPVIAALFNGRPLAIPWLADNASAILEAWQTGVEAGNAILDILYSSPLKNLRQPASLWPLLSLFCQSRLS